MKTNSYITQVFVIASFIFLINSIDKFAQSVTSVQGNIKDTMFKIPLYSTRVTGINQNNPVDTLFTCFTDKFGNYIEQIVSTTVPDATDVPTGFDLGQNYPNPYNPSTKFNVSIPNTGNYMLGIFDVTGAELFKQEFDLSPGSYVFDVSGLGAAGIKFYRFTGEDFNETKKMVQLDGSYFNPSVSVSSGISSSRLGKINNLEMRISAEKPGYSKDSVDVSYVLGSVNTLDFSLSQIPRQDTIWVFTDQNMVPTNTPGNGAVVVGKNGATQLFNGTTDINGELEAFFIANYVTNPLDSTDKKYAPTSISVTVTRGNTAGATQEFVVDGSDITWENDLVQTPISKMYNYSIFVQNSDNGTGVSGALVTGKKTSNDSTMISATTNGSGLASGTDNYLGYENDVAGQFNFVGNMTWTANKSQFSPGSVSTTFSSNIADTIQISPVPPPTRDWVFHVQDPLDNPLNPTLFVRTEEGQDYEFLPQSDGVYDISVQTSGNSVKLWWNHTDLQELGYIMPPNKQGQDKNIAQNDRAPIGELDTLTVSNISLLEQYAFTKLKMLHKVVDGRDMYGEDIQNILSRAGATVRFMNEPSLGTPAVDVVVYGSYENNSHLSSADSTRIMNFTTGTWDLSKNVDYNINYIYSFDDPLWQDILARGGDNSVLYRFRSGTPGNSLTYISSTNGLLRIKNATGFATPQNSDGILAEELIQAAFNLNDPNSVQGLGPYVWNNGWTDFAGYVAAYVSEADNQLYKDMGTDKSEKKNNEELKEEYNNTTSTLLHDNVEFNYQYKEN